MAPPQKAAAATKAGRLKSAGERHAACMGSVQPAFSGKPRPPGYEILGLGDRLRGVEPEEAMKKIGKPI
jgi:hypothetical protein